MRAFRSTARANKGASGGVFYILHSTVSPSACLQKGNHDGKGSPHHPTIDQIQCGPLLRPALLQAAAQRCGHICSTLDLNALWIQHHAKTRNNNVNGLNPYFKGTTTNHWMIRCRERSANGNPLSFVLLPPKIPIVTRRFCDAKNMDSWITTRWRRWHQLLLLDHSGGGHNSA